MLWVVVNIPLHPRGTSAVLAAAHTQSQDQGCSRELALSATAYTQSKDLQSWRQAEGPSDMLLTQGYKWTSLKPRQINLLGLT